MLLTSRVRNVEGHWHPAFAPLVEELGRQLRAARGTGAAVSVLHRGEPAVDVWGGLQNSAGESWREDTRVMAFSTGKGCAATLLHALVDAGLAGYDDRVADHWPEFAQAGKGSITIRQVLSHAAGLHRLSDLVGDFWEVVDFERMVDRVARARPRRYDDRTPTHYHGLSFSWLVGELLRRIGKKPIDVLLEERLRAPLGIDGAYFGLPEHEFARCAELASPIEAMTLGHHALGLVEPLARLVTAGRSNLGELRAALIVPAKGGVSWNDRRLRRACLPSTTGVFTARALATMYAGLACGGTSSGVRLVSEKTADALQAVQSFGRDGVMGIAPHWRLGYHGIRLGGRWVPTAFGHCGYRGTGAFAVPERRLAFAFVHNANEGAHPMGGARFQRLARLAVEAARAAS